jgi:hypothetical protein
LSALREARCSFSYIYRKIIIRVAGSFSTVTFDWLERDENWFDKTRRRGRGSNKWGIYPKYMQRIDHTI